MRIPVVPKGASWSSLHQWLLKFQGTGRALGDFEKLLPPPERLRWSRRRGFEDRAVVRVFDFERTLMLGRWLLAARAKAIRQDRQDIAIRLQTELTRATSGMVDEGVLLLLHPSHFEVEPLRRGSFRWPDSVPPQARCHAFIARLQFLCAQWALESEGQRAPEVSEAGWKDSGHFDRVHGLTLNRLKYAQRKGYISGRMRRIGARDRWFFPEPQVLAHFSRQSGANRL